MKEKCSFHKRGGAVHTAIVYTLAISQAVFWPGIAVSQTIYSPAYTFTTLAGSSPIGSADGMASAARFNNPHDVAVDAEGNIYVADTSNQTIRRIDSAGNVTTVAGLARTTGTNDGVGTMARFNGPNGLAVDGAGNIYVCDTSNHTIRKINPAGNVTTLAGTAGISGSADGFGLNASFNRPIGIALDSFTNLYVADSGNSTIRKIFPDGTVTTFAGLAKSTGTNNGAGISARFYTPNYLALDAAGNVYVTDQQACTIRSITPSGVVTTLAGGPLMFGNADGSNNVARFGQLSGIGVDSLTNLFVSDQWTKSIRKVTTDGVVTTYAGTRMQSGYFDGPGNVAQFETPAGIAIDSSNNIIVADANNYLIRGVSSSNVVTTIAGGGVGNSDGPGTLSRFNFPYGIVTGKQSDAYLVDTASHTIRHVAADGTVSTIAGLAGSAGSSDGTNSNARFSSPQGIAMDNSGNLFVADSGNRAIRKVTPDGVVTTLASGASQFENPAGITVDANGNVYVGDISAYTICKVTADGTVTTIAGLAGLYGNADGTNSDARFRSPYSLAVDAAGNVYIADTFNFTIRKMSPAGVVTTVAGLAVTSGYVDGTNGAVRLAYPQAVAIDSVGNLYICDGPDAIRRLTPSGLMTTLAGIPAVFGASDGTASAAQFTRPFGISVDGVGNLYVADTVNCAVRKGFLTSSLPQPQLVSPSLSAGHASFTISGIPNLPVNIQSSVDFTNWQTVGSCILNGGTNFFVDTNSLQGMQFYRAQLR